ncbi:helix-turn-helix transcriptional regulator [Streptomyces sp. NPDC058464]|uniref:helix-turn-helix domain-containing protein n=1 Tax=Streptomyces sp. NPDC058464 TaxID=3346511 RepID=UPI0036553A88
MVCVIGGRSSPRTYGTVTGGPAPREREVPAVVAQGLTNIEIGRALHLSEGGGRAHIGRLLTELACGDRVRAVRPAVAARPAAESHFASPVHSCCGLSFPSPAARQPPSHLARYPPSMTWSLPVR